MQDDLVERVAELLEDADAWDSAACLEIARAIIPMVLTEAETKLPDDIDLFRAMRKAGRSDRAKAMAVDRLINDVIRALKGQADAG